MRRGGGGVARVLIYKLKIFIISIIYCVYVRGDLNRVISVYIYITIQFAVLLGACLKVKADKMCVCVYVYNFGARTQKDVHTTHMGVLIDVNSFVRSRGAQNQKPVIDSYTTQRASWRSRLDQTWEARACTQKNGAYNQQLIFVCVHAWRLQCGSYCASSRFYMSAFYFLSARMSRYKCVWIYYI